MSLSRRVAIQLMAMSTAFCVRYRKAASAAACDEAPAVTAGQSTKRVDDWHRTHDRVFLGGRFWANPMEDWRVVDGAAECQTSGGDRNIQLLTHQLTNADGAFSMSVDLTQVEQKKTDGGAGFRIGLRSELNEYRSNSFAKGGISAGVIGRTLILSGRRISESVPLDSDITQMKNPSLHIVGKPNDKRYSLTLTLSADGVTVATVSGSVPSEAIAGNVALVSNFDPGIKKGRGARYRFSNWRVDGDAFTVDASKAFGPILWSMYSLSDSRSDEGFVMTMNGLTGPLGEKDNQDLELHIQKDGEWQLLKTATLDSDAWTAKFRIANWDEKTETPYKLVYRKTHSDGSAAVDEWKGKIQANPTGRPLRLAALTCQNHYGFPYEPVVENVVKLQPDMLYFSGDQIYESHGGYGLIRDPAGPAILNYLRKFYMFGWSFRHALKDAPTVCLPDDHDVFQGNVWGEGGMQMKNIAGGASSKGGYREPARMVNVVHRTCCGHHPDCFDSTPCEQDISVYYGDMVYGDTSFAILGDRQWKSGPDRVETGSGRADHVKDIKVDTLHLDKPGLILLGERQEKFLEHWVNDWKGHTMKVLLSQTVFAGVATHHGGFTGYLKADLDSGGWPQTPRNNAIKIISKGMPLHINGDQHLTTLVQYGVDEHRDGCWSFCTPAIAAGYPRWWRPDEVGMPHTNRPGHGLPNTGEYLDGFGNKAFVYAVGNPVVGKDKNRYRKAHEKGSGFGMVTIDADAKTYRLESFRFLVDATDGKPESQFPGWPVTIHQKENGGENLIG